MEPVPHIMSLDPATGLETSPEDIPLSPPQLMLTLYYYKDQTISST